MDYIDFSTSYASLVKEVIGYYNGVKKQVVALVRLNEDDQKIRIFFDERYGAGTLPENRKPITQLKPLGAKQKASTDSVTKGILSMWVNERQTVMGGHAEEIMIRTWEDWMQTAFPIGAAPSLAIRTVDVFITNVPCWNASSSFVLGDYIVPGGCANKLVFFSRMLGQAVWKIAYLEGYGRVAHDPATARTAAGSKLKAIMDENQKSIDLLNGCGISCYPLYAQPGNPFGLALPLGPA